MVPIYRSIINISMYNRPFCSVCKTRPRAIAYHKYQRVYFRSKCSACIRKNKRLKPAITRWQQAGYKKKMTCDRCGFRAKHTGQTLVYHIDGDLNNSDLKNLRTICLNCSIEVNRSDLPWRRGDLEEDR